MPSFSTRSIEMATIALFTAYICMHRCNCRLCGLEQTEETAIRDEREWQLP